MVWPLVLEHAAGLRVLRWMGEPVSQYGDVLIDRQQDAGHLLRRAWGAVIARLRPDVVHLRKVRADAAVAPFLGEIGMLEVATAEAPYLDLASAPDFAAYEQRYSGKARKNRRRLMRRLSEHGPVSIERYAGGPCAAAAARQAIALKQAWLRGTGRISRALADERFAAFFADAAEGKGRPAGCQLMVMTSNGETAGIAIDVTSGGRRAAHLIVHDPRLDHVSAGTLLLQEWIRAASNDDIDTFDLLAPAYDYKRDWADGSVAVADHAIGLTLRGDLYTRVFLSFARERLKAAAEGAARGLKRIGSRLGMGPRGCASSSSDPGQAVS
jgi:CelD/BcsL family acetyltransferase involved in cellulose biosynthesis